MKHDDDKKWQIPKKYRLDLSDDQSVELLKLANEQQVEWGKTAASPFARQNPRTLMRSKAWKTVETLEPMKDDLDDVQIEMLAEAFALIGRYDLAAQTTKANREIYEQYWTALFLEDSAWCKHPDKHKYIKEYIFSIKHGQEMPLLACNVCRTLNVADAPDSLKEASNKRASIRDATKGLSQDQVKSFLQTNVGVRKA